jgi:hypothetical protein
MRKSWRTIRKEKIKARCSAAGKRSQEVQAAKRMAHASTVWSLVRTLEIKRADGSLASTWRVFSTGEPEWPLSVEFDGKIHRFMSIRRLSPLIARKMFETLKP